MGRKKKFIDKKEASTFHVVHRSQQDKAQEGEGNASEFVLIPSAPPRSQGATKAQRQGHVDKSKKTERRDHINALGLPNDGYDYEQHLMAMGGGTFVSRSGKVDHCAQGAGAGARGGRGEISIPEEALPSEEILDRRLDSVTISEKVMDADMRRALAGDLAGVQEGCDEDENNLLDDDFVVQAAGADDRQGFDFDAHVARLMEASARETGLRQRTKDDDLETRGLSRLRRDSDDSSASEAGSGEFDEALLEGLDINEAGGNVGNDTARQAEDRTAVDAHFEATLAAYDSDEWGELDEDDDDVQGNWDVEENEFANRCMNDFLAENEDSRWVDGVERLPQEQRAIAAATLDEGGSPGGGGAARGEQRTTGGGPPDRMGTASGGSTATGPRLGKLRELGDGLEDAEEDFEEEDEVEDVLNDIRRHNEYLREKQVERWDCETIVSTYSNMDNHPSVLGIGRKTRPRRPRDTPTADATARSEGNEACSSMQVELSSKTGLPLGVLPQRTFNDRDMVSLSAGRNEGEKRDTEESAEEKRLRKSRIKEEKRSKRVQKKSVKKAFTAEAKVAAHVLANPEAPQNRSVFSYS